MSDLPPTALDRATDKACAGPYVAETEALEHERLGKPDIRWWMIVEAAAFEARAMLRLARGR